MQQKKCKIYCATSINNFNSILSYIMQTETENSATRKGRGMTTFRSLIIACEALNIHLKIYSKKQKMVEGATLLF